MAFPTQPPTTTCDVYRPFGAASPTTTGVACRLVPCLDTGRDPSGTLIWSHCVDVDASADVRDGVTRTAGTDDLTYADGDELRIPPGATSSRYVVVWVEVHNLGTAMEFKRAYLLRHSAKWPGP